MSSRSFTIDKVTKSDGSSVRYTGGRFISTTPAGAAKKMFSHICSSMRTCPGSLKIKLHEITQGSNKKEFNYRVSKKKEITEIKRGKELVTFTYKTKTKAI